MHLAPLRGVKRLILGAIFFGAALSMVTSAALSQGTEGTAEQQEACTPDAIKLCSMFIPDPNRVKDCLIQRIAALSLRCREVIQSLDSHALSVSPHKRN
jgi:hypothetical protein